MSKTKVSVDVRVDSIDKASWQAEAAAADVSVSELVRQRMSGPVVVAPSDPAPAVPELTRVAVNLDSDELKSLRGWLDLADSDGEVDDALLAGWKTFAAKSNISFPELLTRIVLYANVQHI